MTQTQEHNVPALRFPEFSGEWKTKSIGDVVNIFDGTHQTPKYVKTGVPFFSVEHVTSNQFKATKFISEEVFEKENKRVSIEKGDILMTRIGSIGIAKYVDWDVRASFYVSLALIKPTVDVIGRFLVQCIYDDFFQRELWERTIHVAFPKKINLGEIGNCHVCLPTNSEQQKIADFLSSIDSKIAHIAKKKALLEHYKKGLMQKLFSQELRFKDAQGKGEFPDWVEKRLGDFYEFKSTNSLSRDKLNYEGCGVRNIHYGDIHTKYKPAFDVLQEQVPFVNSSVDLSGISEDKYCQYGDLIIADASEDYDDIGKTIELINLNNEKVLAGLHTLLARLISKDIHIGFGTFVMACASVRRQIKIIAQGTKVLGISAGRMAKIELPMPCSEEQQKIAAFLSSVDTKIDLIATELEHAQTFKKGLLQQMFI